MLISIVPINFKVLGSSRPLGVNRVFTVFSTSKTRIDAKLKSETFHSSYQLSKKLLYYLSTKAAVYILALGKFCSGIPKQWVCKPVFLSFNLVYYICFMFS